MYRSWRRRPVTADENKAAHILFSYPLSEPGSGFIWGASECNLYQFRMGFQSAVSIQYQQKSLENTPMWHAYTKPTRLTSILVSVKDKKPTLVQKNWRSRLLEPWCSQRQKEISSLNLKPHKTRGTLPWRSSLVLVIQSGHALALVVFWTKQKPAPWRRKSYTHTWHCFSFSSATWFRETEMTHSESAGNQQRTLL